MLGGAVAAPAAAQEQGGDLDDPGEAEDFEAVDTPFIAAPGQPGDFVEAGPDSSEAAEYPYFGPHPPDSRYEQDYCTVEGPHLHAYPPFDPMLFVASDGYYYFVGDPRDFGYGGELYSYYDNHPVDAYYGGGYCYLMGQHHHWFFTAGPSYAYADGVYYYRGGFGPTYYRDRARWQRYYRDDYPRYHERPRYTAPAGRPPENRSTRAPVGRARPAYTAPAGQPYHPGGGGVVIESTRGARPLGRPMGGGIVIIGGGARRGVPSASGAEGGLRAPAGALVPRPIWIARPAARPGAQPPGGIAPGAMRQAPPFGRPVGGYPGPTMARPPAMARPPIGYGVPVAPAAAGVAPPRSAPVRAMPAYGGRGPGGPVYGAGPGGPVGGGAAVHVAPPAAPPPPGAGAPFGGRRGRR